MSKLRRKKKGRISLVHLSPEEALRRAMAVPYERRHEREKEHTEKDSELSPREK